MLYFWKKELTSSLNFLNLNMKKTIALLLLCLCITNCEKDDLCSEATPTTPKLVLEFFDITSPDETKNVAELTAYGIDDDNQPVIFFDETIATRSEISIPLRTDADQTKFVLHRNYEIDDLGTEDDDDDIVLGNPEVITVTYEREEVYVSRACGYKTVFNNITFSVALDEDNWIINSEIVVENVELETETHVKVFH